MTYSVNEREDSVCGKKELSGNCQYDNRFCQEMELRNDLADETGGPVCRD